MDVSRRRFLVGAGVASAVVLTATAYARPAMASPGDYEVTHTDAEWRQLLTADQYDVLRQAGTEMPYSSPLNDEHGQASSAVPDARKTCSRPTPNSTAAPGGRASGSRWTTPWSKTPTALSV